jgi:hypothetical protein
VSVAGLAVVEFPILGALIYGLHLALTYGSLAGLLFWSLIVPRVPTPLGNCDKRAPHRTIFAYGLALVAYLAGFAWLIIALEPG